jgi:GGDEF domain-containing protein
MAVIVDELSPLQAPEIEIRDERGEQAPTAWIASIARLLERYARDRVPFAVLLVELADVERLRHAELPGEVSRLTGLVEAAVSGELGPADSLTRESPGRYWLLAPETDSDAARALVERLSGAVRSAASHRGVPLEVAIGIAVCPLDGSQAVALAAHAEIALYAAQASGGPVA